MDKLENNYTIFNGSINPDHLQTLLSNALIQGRISIKGFADIVTALDKTENDNGNKTDKESEEDIAAKVITGGIETPDQMVTYPLLSNITIAKDVRTLFESCIALLQRNKSNFRINAICLYGPPGTGKTFTIKSFVKTYSDIMTQRYHKNLTFFNISAGVLKSRFVGGSEKNVVQLFKEARKKIPCIIFLDEVETLVTSRDGSNDSYSPAVVSEFLIQINNMEEWNKTHEVHERIMLICATNMIDKLDPAYIRRMDRICLYDIPTIPEIESYLQITNKKDLQGVLSPSDITELAKIGYERDLSMSDISKAIEIGKSKAFTRSITNSSRRDNMNIKTQDDTEEAINKEDIKQSISNTNATNKKSKLEMYRQMNFATA